MNTIALMPVPTVFLSYSHKDQVWKERLVTHLAVLEEQGLLKTWDDRGIHAGESWREEIARAMERAKVAVLLISAHSLASRFILDTEVRRLLERREADGIRILPVIVKPCPWKQVPWLAAMQVRPRDGKPLSSFSGHRLDSELVKIAEEIFELLGAEPPTWEPGPGSLDQPAPRAGTPSLPAEKPKQPRSPPTRSTVGFLRTGAKN